VLHCFCFDATKRRSVAADFIACVFVLLLMLLQMVKVVYTAVDGAFLPNAELVACVQLPIAWYALEAMHMKYIMPCSHD
jgi:hypothetical protein